MAKVAIINMHQTTNILNLLLFIVQGG